MSHSARYCLLLAVSTLGYRLTDAIGTVFLIELGLDYRTIGVFFSVLLACMALTGGPAGAFADLYGRRRAFVLGSLLVGFAFAGRALSHSIPFHFTMACVVGIGAALNVAPLQAWAVDGLADADEGARRRLLTTGATMTKLLTLLGGSLVFIVRVQSYRLVYLVSGVILFVSAAIGLVMMRPDPRPARTRPAGAPDSAIPALNGEPRASTGRTPVRRRTTVLTMLTGYVTALYLLISLFTFAWQPRLVGLGLGSHQLPLALGVFSACEAAASWAVGTHRAARNTYVIVLIVPMLAAMGLLVGCGARAAPLAYAGFCIYSGANATLLVLYEILINEALDRQWRATLLGASRSFALMACVVSQPLLGALVESAGAFAAGLLSVALCALLVPAGVYIHAMRAAYRAESTPVAGQT